VLRIPILSAFKPRIFNLFKHFANLSYRLTRDKITTMKFGQVEKSHSINTHRRDFLNQPLTGAGNQSKELSQPKFYLGAPVWGKKEWVGRLYPPKTQPKDYLKYYAVQMNGIELNTTFYRIPNSAQVTQWRESVQQGFKFCPKIYQGISQFDRLSEIPTLTQQFCQSVENFNQNLGLCFLQLPPYFGPERILILRRFFKLLPPHFPLAIEFRHPGWFHDHQLIQPVFDLLCENQIAPVMTDASGRADVLHASLSTSKVLIRFLGNSLDPSDFVRLDQWVNAFGRWFEVGISEFYFFVHQPEEEGVIELVEYLVKCINERYRVSHGLEIQGIDLQRSQSQIELF